MTHRFANLDRRATAEVERIARNLELGAGQPRQLKMRQACYTAAGFTKGMKILELGCGTGVATRELARIVGRTGAVVGVDSSTKLLGYAKTLTVAGGAPIEYVAADARKLDHADDSFDASIAITLLAHTPRADEVVREMRRVTRGTLVVLDYDFGTLVYDHDDRELTRRITQHGMDSYVLDGMCGRRLAGLLVSLGITGVQCWPFVYTERDSRSFLISIAEQLAAFAVADDAISEAEGKAWLDGLHARGAKGTFFGSLNYYCALGRKSAP